MSDDAYSDFAVIWVRKRETINKINKKCKIMQGTVECDLKFNKLLQTFFKAKKH